MTPTHKPIRVVFIGCVAFSHRVLEHVLALPEADVVGVVTRSASAFNADFRSLEGLAEEAGVPCFLAEGNDQAVMAAWIAERNPDVVYCFGWSYLLRSEVLALPPLGVVGYHPAALPRNRGRHPIIWALALGLPETASTFFLMDEGADSGDILSQVLVPIEETDDAGDLYERLTEVALKQVAAFTRQFAEGTTRAVPQDHGAANYWRKRGRADGEIDWRMPARGVYNLVRSLARPYPGAHFVVDGTEVKVWRAEVVSDAFPDVANLEPGKVLAAGADGVAVRCGDGVVRIVEHELPSLPQPGTYL